MRSLKVSRFSEVARPRGSCTKGDKKGERWKEMKRGSIEERRAGRERNGRFFAPGVICNNY
jgi:hypothetical protein